MANTAWAMATLGQVTPGVHARLLAGWPSLCCPAAQASPNTAWALATLGYSIDDAFMGALLVEGQARCQRPGRPELDQHGVGAGPPWATRDAAFMRALAVDAAQAAQSTAQT
jgi:hypothetical protein